MKYNAINEGTMCFEKTKCYVGDPCYVLPEENWSDFCNLLGDLPLRDGAVVDAANGQFFICGTAYGDGCYNLTKNDLSVARLPVDAGLLSVIPFDMLDEKAKVRAVELGTVVEVNGEAIGEEGNLYFGEYEVITGDTEEDEEPSSMFDDCDEDEEDCDECNEECEEEEYAEEEN